MGDRVVTYNDEISISHPIEGLDITGAVKAEELYQLLGKLKKDEIVMEASENELILTCGKTRAGLAFQEEISLPLEEVGEIGDWKPLPEGFCEAVAFVIPSASRNMVTPAFTAVHVRKDGIIEASDGYRVTQKRLAEIELENCLIPAQVAKELIKYPITHQAPGEGWRHFKTEDGTIFSCRILEEQYPDVEAIGIMNVTGKVLEWPRELGEALDRAKIFGDEEVSLTIKDGKIRLEGQSEFGWIKESLSIGYSGESFSILVNPQFLRDMLEQSPSCVVGERSMKFTGSDWAHVVYMKVN